ncbi:BF3164 family lipoprotein [Algoriphagus sp. oki45]|uniref:BF3164 family lipoprotein n=1 Tax=Algoriphagus sp. oki45 TaxID=3067294 RepID=UPI0030C6B0B8
MEQPLCLTAQKRRHREQDHYLEVTFVVHPIPQAVQIGWAIDGIQMKGERRLAVQMMPLCNKSILLWESIPQLFFVKKVKRKNYLNNFLILLLSVACAPNTPNSPFDFPANGLPEFNLSSKKYYYPEVLNPMHVKQKGEYLILMEIYRIPPEKPLIHLINKTTLSYFSAKGITGFGPNEIANAELFDPGFDPNTFWIYSSRSKRMSEFSLLDTNRLSISEFRQPEGMFMIYNLYFTKDSTFLGISASDPNRLIELDYSGNRVNAYGTWEKIADRSDLDDYLLGELNKGWFRANSKKTIYVKASIFRDRLEIFDYRTKEFVLVDGPRLELPKFKISGSGANSALIFNPEEAYGHRDIAFGESYIYDLYGGFNEAQIQQSNVIAKTIFVLTDKGEMVAKLNLDRSLRSISVDETMGKIYGITTDADPGIAVFDIPKDLLEK